jgi:hypothetical protein
MKTDNGKQDGRTRYSAVTIVNHFGGAVNLRDLCARNGVQVTYGAIRKWKERDCIPKGGVALLVGLGHTIRKPLFLPHHSISKDTQA